MKADVDHIDRSEVHFTLDCETEAEKSVFFVLFKPENIGDGCYVGSYDAHIIVDYSRLGNGKRHCQIIIQAKRKERKGKIRASQKEITKLKETVDWKTGQLLTAGEKIEELEVENSALRKSNESTMNAYRELEGK